MTINRDDWQRVLISPKASIISAIEKIDKEAQRILLVVDDDKILLGVVTDGNIRRHLLKRGSLDAPVSDIMSLHPITAQVSDNQEQLFSKMQKLNILHLPIVDIENKVVGLETLSHLTQKIKRDNWVIFMAGGLGTRLHPLTLDFPKPLVKIGNKPILEILLENFIKSGFHQFYFSVNYKAEMIQDYFGNGEKWGVTIHYLHEDIALGTIGSLQILPKKPNESFFVVNADIVTNLEFSQILEFHETNSNHPIATVCVRQYQYTIPYGVMHIDPCDQRITKLEEKPTYHYFINAGIYVLNPKILSFFSSIKIRYDMPSFIMELIHKKQIISTFPIREYWMDMGSHDNLSQVAVDYEKVFI